MIKLATSVPVSKGKKEKKLTLCTQSNIYLIKLYWYRESHQPNADSRKMILSNKLVATQRRRNVSLLERERERDSHVETVRGRQL
jgi:hypothetical protein